MKGIVPDEICRRKQKLGFYFPERHWLNELKAPLSDALRKMDDPEGCIRKKFVVDNLDKLYTTDNLLFQQFIFRCYSYLLWRNNL